MEPPGGVGVPAAAAGFCDLFDREPELNSCEVHGDRPICLRPDCKASCSNTKLCTANSAILSAPLRRRPDVQNLRIGPNEIRRS